MSTVWMTSDWHLGHRNILKYRSDFKDRQVLEDLLVSKHKERVGKRDTTYFHGDMCFDHASLGRIKELSGTKLLILGNHDDHLSVREYLEVFDDVIGPIKYKGFWLSHQPLHPQELYFKVNIHGHTHNQNVLDRKGNQDHRYVNVSVDVTDWAPVKFQDIKEISAANLASVDRWRDYENWRD